MSLINVPTLATLLNDAKDAHVEFERVFGPDPDWPRWYAKYIVDRAQDLGRTERWAMGITFKPGSWWMGIHWGRYNRRFCVNPIPMVTIWVALPGGVPGSGWRLK